MKQLILSALAFAFFITSATLFAEGGQFKMGAWLKKNKKQEACADAMKASVGTTLAKKIEIPNEASINRSLSYFNNENLSDLERGTRVGTWYGRASWFVEAGLKVVDDGTSLKLSRGSKLLKAWAFDEEPIAELRFTSDKNLKINDSKTDGFVSVIYWTHALYYRLEGGKLTPIKLSDYEQVIKNFIDPRFLATGDVRPDQLYTSLGNHTDDDNVTRFAYNLSVPGSSWASAHFYPDIESILTAAGVLYSKTALDKDKDGSYRKSLYEQFNKLHFRVAERLPVYDSQDQETDYFLIARMTSADRQPSLLRTALGKFADVMHDSAKNQCDVVRNNKNPRVEGYPTTFLRMAVYALQHSLDLRSRFADAYNDKKNGETLRVTSNGFVLNGGEGCTSMVIQFAKEPFSGWGTPYVKMSAQVPALAEQTK